MDKFEKILEKASAQEYEELYILYAINHNNFEIYTKDSSASNLRNWEASKEKLDRLTEQLWGKYFQADPCFENVAAVVKHLHAQGYKIKKSKVYADAQKRLLQVDPDGRVTELAVRAYAAGLEKKSSIRPEDIEDRSVRKLENEIKALEVRAEAAQFDLDIKKGKYILRSELEMELAARAAVFEAGFRFFIQAKAGDIIEAVAGDRGKAADLVDMLGRHLDSLMNDFADTEKFQVMIVDGTDGDGVAEQEEAEAVGVE